MNELIYIASPYSHDDPKVIEENFWRVTNYCAERVALGDVVLSPITYGHTLLEFKDMPNDWPFWTNFCLSILVKCDRLRVLKMEGWEDSQGVEAEISFAKDHNIPVEYIEYIDGKFYGIVDY